MSEATLEAYIRQLLESHRTPQVTVAWQGGEPTLMKLEFFRRAVELVEKYRRPGQTVQHTFQTNGLLLDDDWCAFFKEHNFLVGLSVDGPRELHDTYRVDRRGQGTFDLVMRGWRHLRRHGVDFNILCTVNAANQQHGRTVYRFFRDELGAKWVQFIPIVERATEETIEIANQGWSEQPGQQAPALHADRQPGHRALGRRRAVRPLPGRYLRRMGAPRRGPGLRAALRRDARGLSSAAICCASTRRPAATARRWSTTATSTPAITSSSRATSSATSTRRTCSTLVASPEQRKFGQDKRDTLTAQCQQLRGPAAVQRRLSEGSLRALARRRAGPELPLRGPGAVLHPHRPGDATRWRSCCSRAARRPT